MKPSLALFGFGLLLGAGVVLYRDTVHQKALAALSAQALQAHHADSAKADTAVALASSAAGEAQTLREAARVEVRRDRAAQAAVDSAITEAASERDRAQRLLDDSVATVLQLRSEVGRLVARSRDDSLAAASERTAHDRTVMALLAALVSDSTAIAKGLAATNAMTARALAAERLAASYKAQIPSPARQWVERGLLVGAGVLLVKAIQR